MKTLVDLLDSAEGLCFLESEGVSVTQQEFKDQLKTPIRPDLADLFGTEKAKLVCSGQQVYVDYRQSVLSKIETLREFKQDKDLFPFFLWVDTDRSGSDNLATKFAWPQASKKGPITILPRRTRDIESRFVTLNSSVLRSAVDKLETRLRQSGESVKGGKQRYLKLRAIFTGENPGTLSEFNLNLTEFLLTNVYGYSPPSVRLSDLLDRGMILDEVDLFVNRISDVVLVFNEAIQSLVRKGIDPQVKPLPEHYLPLFSHVRSTINAFGFTTLLMAMTTLQLQPAGVVRTTDFIWETGLYLSRKLHGLAGGALTFVFRFSSIVL